MCRVNDPSGSQAPAINVSKADMKQKLVTWVHANAREDS